MCSSDLLYGNTSNSGDRGNYILERQDLGFLIIGKEMTNSSNDNLCLINIDGEGSEIWHSLYGGNLGHRPGIKGGYFPVPPVDSAQDIRTEFLEELKNLGLKMEKH